MPKLRKSNKHLPQRVYIKCNSYYFVDCNNKWHLLGKRLPEAMAEWAKRYSTPQKICSLNDVMDRYLLEVAPFKAKKTYANEMVLSRPIRTILGNMAPEDITPLHVYKYLDYRGKISKTSANNEKSLLSIIFTNAIKWGACKVNPCKEVSRLKTKKYDRYVEDYEFEAVRNLASPFMRCVMDFAYISGLRRSDILSLKLTQLTDEGIRIVTNKTKAKMLIEWSPALLEVVERAKEIRKSQSSFYLFCNQSGKPYSGDGFGMVWNKLMRKAHSKGAIQNKFKFHDIRRKTASDHVDIESARKALGHTTQKMTSEYISGWQKSKPLK